MPSASPRAASEVHTKLRYANLRPSLDTITAYGFQQGFHPPALKRLLDVIVQPKFLDQTSENALVKSLYPTGQVSPDAVYTIVGSLGLGALKASIPTQQGLVKWLVMVCDQLEDAAGLSNMYSVLFNLLDTLSLRADLCCLLARITRKKNVKPFRLQMLQDLLRTAGPEPELLKLMTVFDKLVPGKLDLGRSKKGLSIFVHPDPNWGVRLTQIQSKERLDLENVNVQRTPDYRFSDNIEEIRATSPKDCSRRLGFIQDFVDSLARPPDHEFMISDLQDTSLLYRAALDPEDAFMAKVNQTLSSALQQHPEMFKRNGEETRSLSGVLDKALALAKHIKTLPKSLVSFLENYLLQWDGQSNQGTILELLSYLPMTAFEGRSSPHSLRVPLSLVDLYSKILQPLENSLRPIIPESTSTSTSTSTPVLLLNCYSSLLSNWTTRLQSLTTPPTPSQTAAISALLQHLTHLPITVLTSSPLTQPTINLILNHYNAYLPLFQPPLSLPLAPPSPLIISLIHLTNPTMPTLNHLSSILASYKTAYEILNTLDSPPRAAAHVKALNASLIDTCNLLFRSRAFNTTDPHALGCLLPANLITALSDYTNKLDPPQPLTGLFSLSQHPALVALSIASFREIEDSAEEKGEDALMIRHAGPVNQKSLAILGREGGVRMDWKEYRVAVLRWLETMGAKGLSELGEATMKGLMGGQAVAKT